MTIAMRQPNKVDRQIAERQRRGVGVSTAERVLHSGLAFDGPANAAQRIAMAPLDRLHAKTVKGQPILSKRQYEAGDRYRDDCHQAGLMKSGGFSMEPSDGRGKGGFAFENSDAAARALTRVVKAHYAIGAGARRVIEAVLWPEDGITSVAEIGGKLFGRTGRWAETAGIVALQMALDRLAEFHETGR